LLWFTSIPSSIKINSAKICSVVSDWNSIRVHHWYDIYLVIFTQETSLFLIGCYKLDKSLASVTTWGLPWMLSSRYNYQRAWTFSSWILFIYLDRLYIIFTNRFSNDFSFHVSLSPRFFLNSIKKIIKIFQSIWIWLSNTKSIVFIRCHQRKSQRIIISTRSINFILIFIIFNRSPRTKPALPCSFLSLSRMNTWLHSIIK
jgi:hypothetical protein